jgi:G3E family GTPase
LDTVDSRVTVPSETTVIDNNLGVGCQHKGNAVIVNDFGEVVENRRSVVQTTAVK